MRIKIGLVVFALVATPVAAQDQSLADIRQDLQVLTVELQRLRTELSTTGTSGMTIGGGTIDRVNAIEAELQRLTSNTEQIEFRIGQVVEDGTNRIGDLEFRLCELEATCDIGTLGTTLRIGGGSAPVAATPPPAAPQGSEQSQTQLAVSEQDDFRRAQEALANSDFRTAAELFATFRETYPGGPLEVRALIGQGKAQEGLGDTRSAARSYLDTYSNYPDAAVAPEALFRLGLALNALGSVSEGCVMLSEVGNRYSGSEFAGQAIEARTSLGCQ
ncbi:tetratricopeptide repeat protein [Puniceibacterium sp. IMCC21224]|uniref:tetratricopeptide repeat protein n=1 Tax=Puniceibacterium sp. IMCC21224 TaxID=1618204 RepID=UPI00064E0C8A|nr:tetratricopeptide repeat protein [Puniceibacterium sp. IMCC21224]KMK68129.1 hypothetical protein IMCC21224_113009 [Puniceibacterium sp. IMCC21224]